jgi:hypothetical protein
VKLQDTESKARRMFEDFNARGSKRRYEMGFGWPTQMQEVGQAKAQMYRSNKWKSDPKDYEDYKHIAESYQLC